MYMTVFLHMAAAKQPGQERITALPWGMIEANKGQVTPSLSQIYLLPPPTHSKGPTLSQKERLTPEPVHSIQAKWRGMSMLQGFG